MTRRTATRAALWSLLISGLSLTGTTPTAQATSVDSFITSLGALYQNLQTVRLEAEVEIQMRSEDPDNPETRIGKGTFSYAADRQGRYRVRFDLDPRLGLIANADHAFDGHLYQWLRLEAGVLTFQRTEPPMVIVAIPNPFVIPVRFLSSTPTLDLVVAPRLSNTSDAARWQRVHTARVQQMAGSDSVSLRTEGEEAEHFTSRIEVGHEGRVGKVFEERADGSLTVEMHFMEYKTVSGREFPRRIDFWGHDANGVLRNVFRYEITEIEFDRPLPRDTFRIEPRPDDRVFDSDTGEEVKELPRK